MNLKSITALIALSLALAGCGNKGPLIQTAPPPVESTPAEAETVVPTEVVPAETPAADEPPADAAPAETPPVEDVPTAPEVPEADAQDG